MSPVSDVCSKNSLTSLAISVDVLVDVSAVSTAILTGSVRSFYLLSQKVILIAPGWPSQLWFPHLLHLCVDHRFHVSSGLLFKLGHFFYRKKYYLHARSTLCSTSRKKDLRRSLCLQQQVEDSPQAA